MKDEICAVINPNYIDMLTRLIEAYDNLGIVSTLDQTAGRVVVRVTSDTWSEVMDILNHLPFEIIIENETV